jgi:hypothetical protein
LQGYPVYSTYGNITTTSTVGNSKCTETDTGRTLAVYGSATNKGEIGRKDISLCNLVSGGTKYVYIPSIQQIFVLDDPISFQMFTIISVLTVAMAVTLSHNLEFSAVQNGTPLGSIPCISLMLILFGCVTFATGNWHVLSPYVTLEDRLAVVVLSGYVLYYILRLLFLFFVCGDTRSPVNPVLAVIILVTARLYGTIDNPYIAILSFLWCARFFTKLCNFSIDNGTSGICNWAGEAIDILLDGGILSLLVFIGMAPQYNNDPVVLALYVVQGLYMAITFNSIMIKNKL